MSAILESAVPAAVRPLPVSTVLLIEDERKTRELIRYQLLDLGQRVVMAESAYEAIRLVNHTRPDTILVDGLLPQMHGFEVARFVRAMDTSYRPRIILMTAVYKHVRYQNEAKLKYGIDAYLLKPFTSERLREVLS